jgi:hypothetical protein
MIDAINAQFKPPPHQKTCDQARHYEIPDHICIANVVLVSVCIYHIANMSGASGEKQVLTGYNRGTEGGTFM